MRMGLVLAVLLATTVPGVAQSVTTGTAANDAFSGPTGGSPVKKLLVDGYEIKTGFSDNAGGAYMVLQKATSAYMCHSNPTQTCEKLN